MALSSVVNVVLCLVLIPRHGLAAAIFATYVAELTFAALVATTARRKALVPVAR
jgi:O-antigen/teichoic acid export membrane protein